MAKAKHQLRCCYVARDSTTGMAICIMNVFNHEAAASRTPRFAVDEVPEFVEHEQVHALAHEQCATAAHAIGHRAAAGEWIAMLVEELLENEAQIRATLQKLLDNPVLVFGRTNREKA